MAKKQRISDGKNYELKFVKWAAEYPFLRVRYTVTGMTGSVQTLDRTLAKRQFLELFTKALLPSKEKGQGKTENRAFRLD